MPTAEQLERSRDLKVQLKELAQESDQEIVFRETSPRKQYATLYSRADGEPLRVPLKIAERALEKRLPDGGFMFTTRQDEAPEYKLGDFKCFLHPDSIERQSGALDAVGLTGITCPAAHLSSVYSKRIHALHRHRQQWEAYQEHVSDQKEQAANERQERQTAAMLEMAGRAAAKGKTNARSAPLEET